VLGDDIDQRCHERTSDHEANAAVVHVSSTRRERSAMHSLAKIERYQSEILGRHRVYFHVLESARTKFTHGVDYQRLVSIDLEIAAGAAKAGGSSSMPRPGLD
jgi:hypothetical protein